MNLDALAKLVVEAGAPVLGAAIGGPAGAAATLALHTLAKAFGVGVTPEAVAAAVQTDPKAAEKVASAESESAGQVAVVMAQTAADLAKAEMQRESFFSWGWRPAGAWMCIGLTIWQFLVVPIVKSSIAPAFPPIPWEQLAQIFTIYMGLYMGGHTIKAVADARRA